jgi:hypothetical protein
VSEIDGRFVDDPNGYVPPEAIRGRWLVDSRGRPTGEFEDNPAYGPPQDGFSKLLDPDAWAGWLGDDPAAAIRASIAKCLAEQVEGSTITWLKVLASPRYLTAGKRAGIDEQRSDHVDLIVTRAGIAIPFALSVASPPDKRHTLLGVFTWVAVDLDRPTARRDRVWLDLDGDFDWAEAELEGRLHFTETGDV